MQAWVVIVILIVIIAIVAGAVFGYTWWHFHSKPKYNAPPAPPPVGDRP